MAPDSDKNRQLTSTGDSLLLRTLEDAPQNEQEIRGWQ